jgi:hypothetical protein
MFLKSVLRLSIDFIVREALGFMRKGFPGYYGIKVRRFVLRKAFGEQSQRALNRW